MTAEKLTPTEDLVMEVLAARHRLGETCWTFDARCSKAIESLSRRGLAIPMNGIVEHTVRASLTDQGRRQQCSSDYVPPNHRLVLKLLNKTDAYTNPEKLAKKIRDLLRAGT